VDRRAFFRSFSRQTVTTVAQVAGIAGAVSRGTTAAMVGAVEIGLGSPRANAQRLERTGPGAAAERDADADASPTSAARTSGPGFRNPYRLDDDTLYLLDQRLLPDRLEEIPCRRAADVAFQLRTLAVSGGPVLGQLCAYGLALTARESVAMPAGRRAAELRRASQLLTYARPAAQAARSALVRMEARISELPADADGHEFAVALMDEADAIAAEAALDHAAIAHATADLLRDATGPTGTTGATDEIRVLLHGDPGLLTSGQVGTGIAALQLLAAEGRALKVWVAESRPRLEGARLASWELRTAGIDHTVIADAAVAWLFARERIDAVLMAADWIAADGDAVALIGSRTTAEMAALGLHGDGPTPVYVCAPVLTIGPATFRATSVPIELRPGREVASDHGAPPNRGRSVDNPAVELVPSGRIAAFVTEEGVLRAPFEPSLAGAVGRRAARHRARRAPTSLGDATAARSAASG
jgi:methylthioribose-1-phosphate isomerase